MSARLLWVLILLIGLSACGGGESPAPTNETPPTSENGESVEAPVSTPTESVDDILQAFEDAAQDAAPTLESVFTFLDDPDEIQVTELPFATPRVPQAGELPIVPPGTLVASETQDPDMPRQFTRVQLVRSGGPFINGQQEPPLVIDIAADGQVTRGNRSGQVDLANIDQINALINEMNFFGVQGIFMGTFGAQDEVYLYQITVTNPVIERSLNAHEPFMPQELRQLVARLLLVGDSIP